MISIKKLLHKEDQFLTLLEASAQEGCASVKALAQIVGKPAAKTSMEKLLKSRQKEREISSKIDELLCQSFTTPLEREDIETLGRALYRVPKNIRKFAERYLISAAQLQGVDFSEHIKMLETATHLVQQMVADLRKGPKLSATEANCNALQKLEGQADDMLTASLQALYQGQHDPLKAIILKDLYELLERVFDRCRTAGNVMLQIVLKNS